MSATRCLLLDSSLGPTWVALFTVEQKTLRVVSSHWSEPQALLSGSVLLPTLLERALSDAGWSTRELQRVYAGSGPGSLTGLRVVAGFAEGFASALPQVELYPVSILGFLQFVLSPKGFDAVVLPATRSLGYAAHAGQLAAIDTAKWEETALQHASKILTVGAWPAFAQAARSQALVERPMAELKLELEQALEPEFLSFVSSLVSSHSIHLNYMRPSTAEIGWAARR